MEFTEYTLHIGVSVAELWQKFPTLCVLTAIHYTRINESISSAVCYDSQTEFRRIMRVLWFRIRLHSIKIMLGLWRKTPAYSKAETARSGPLTATPCAPSRRGSAHCDDQ